MELISTRPPLKGRFFAFIPGDLWFLYSAPFSPMNHCSLFLNNTLNVVKEP